MTDDEKLLAARVRSRITQCEKNWAPGFLGFFSPAERNWLLEQRELFSREVETAFFGGYEEAERTLLFYAHADSGETPTDLAPEALTVVRFTSFAEGRELSHRDYLGSLMGLGLKREAVGDILPYEEGKKQICDIFLLASCAGEVLRSLEKVGRTGVHTEEISPEKVKIPELKTREISDTVSSLRLDCVLAAGFRLSRAETKEAIEHGLAACNYLPALHPDATVEEGDVISLRGKGKMVLSEAGAYNRKGRIRVKILLYI